MADMNNRRETATPNQTNRFGAGELCRLDDLDDYEIADGEPDIRGWDLRTTGNRTIGEVTSLIADPAAMKVRYVEAKLAKDLFPNGADLDDDQRKVIIPIRAVRLDTEHDCVLVDHLPNDVLASAPRFGHERLTADRVRPLDEYYGRALGATTGGSRADTARSDRERLTLAEEQLAVGRRPVKEGEVTVQKTVETEHVSKKVPLMHEEITIERRPARPGMSAKAEIRDNEIHIPVMGEEVVTEKRVVPTEEIVVTKQAVRDEQTIEADLKREKAKIDTSGDVRVNERRP